MMPYEVCCWSSHTTNHCEDRLLGFAPLHFEDLRRRSDAGDHLHCTLYGLCFVSLLIASGHSRAGEDHTTCTFNSARPIAEFAYANISGSVSGGAPTRWCRYVLVGPRDALRPLAVWH